MAFSQPAKIIPDRHLARLFRQKWPASGYSAGVLLIWSAFFLQGSSGGFGFVS